MKSLEKLMSASIAEEELLQLKAGAMEEEAPLDNSLGANSTNTNNVQGCKCKNGSCFTPGLNTMLSCGGTNTTLSCGGTNTMLSCGGINTTLSCGGTPGGPVIHPNAMC